MGNLTEKYKDSCQAKEIEQRAQVYYEDIIRRTKYLNKNACGGAEKFYKSSLAFDMGPEIQALFVEAASLVRPDKWKTWEIPGYNDFQEIKSPRSAIRYQIKNGKYGRYKWSDGSIHCTKSFGFFQKDYVGFDGFLDRLFLNKRRTKWTLDEHIFLSRRFCCEGMARIMSQTEKVR